MVEANVAPNNYDSGQAISVYPVAVFDYTYYQKHAHGDDFIFVNIAPPGLPPIPIAIPNPNPIEPTAVIDGAAYGNIPAMLNMIGDSFKKIFDTWNSLKISWAGDSSDAAQELNDQLNKIQRRLFGAKVLPLGDVPGVIGQMSGVAASAATNYSNVENQNAKMFNDMNDSIDYQPLPPETDDDSGDSSDTSTPDPDDINVPWDHPPVTVTY